MSLITSYPALLWIFALAIIPILVHLFARSRPPAYHFSDVAFLQKILKKTARIRKPQDWLTLLLRTLACLALLFAFLHPLLVSKDSEHDLADEKNIVFIIDQSASMAALDGATSRFDQAIAETTKLISELKPDKANVVWSRFTPKTVFPNLGPNIQYLKQEVQQQVPTYEENAPAQALQLAIEQLKQVQGSREIILISDFQATSWDKLQIDIPDSIKLTKIPVTDSDASNLCIAGLRTTPESPVVGQKSTVSALVKNFSNENKQITVYLNAAGSRQSKSIEVAAWGQTEISFDTELNQLGQNSITVGIDEDRFPADDQRHLIVPVRESIKIVSLAQGESQSSQVLSKLADTLSWLTHSQTSSVNELSQADILFLHDWDGQNIEKLAELNQLTTIIAEPSVKCPSESLSNFFVSLDLPNQIDRETNKDGWKANIKAEDAPVFELFSSGEYGNPAAGSFYQRMKLPKGIDNSSHQTTLIAYDDTTPAIISTETTDNPRLLWNLPFSPDLSTWTKQEPFLPFIAELLLQIQPDRESNTQEHPIGAPLRWELPNNVQSETVKLISGEDKSTISTSVTTSDSGIAMKTDNSIAPGIYQWNIGSSLAHSDYVNFPTNESDLRILDPDEIKIGSTAATDSIIQADALAQGKPLWHWLLIISLILLLIESFISAPKKAPSS